MVRDAILGLLKDSWPTLVIFLTIIVIFRIFYYFNGSRKFILHEEILLILFITYVLLLFSLVTSSEVDLSSRVNLIPFKEILRYKVGSYEFYRQVIGNIVMFIPFGFFATYYTKIKKISSITVITLLVSLTIEIVQKHIGRCFDIDDIILNVFGGILGFFIYVGFNAISKKLPSFMRSDGFLSFLSVLILLAFVLYLVGIIRFGWF